MSQPAETPRARAYDPDVQWRVDQLDPDDPARRSALFVVHGIGDQERVDTALALRHGLETAIEDLHRSGLGDVPLPYVAEGYWGDYYNFAESFPEAARTLDENERAFFSRLWTLRSHSALRAWGWFAWQGLRLLWPRPGQATKQVSLLRQVLRWFTYLSVAALNLITLTLLLAKKKYRGVLATVLGDVRIYVEPQGNVERAIVQQIDRRVRDQFLQLLGLDADFRTLPRNRMLKVGGVPYRFDYVTWVAHSLGSVISYNVISDILHRMQDYESGVAGANDPPEVRQQRVENIGRVKQGLHRFFTLGSPLAKIAYLFPGVLRLWPEEYAAQIVAGRRTTNWWVNFFHIWDPVSGVVGAVESFPQAQSAHSRILRLPGWAHVRYWVDRKILKYILTRTYGKDVINVKERVPHAEERKTRRLLRGTYFNHFHRPAPMVALRTVTMPILLLLALGAAIALAYFTATRAYDWVARLVSG
jgi:hypothetical protein